MMTAFRRRQQGRMPPCLPIAGEAHAIGKTIRELPLAHYLKLLFIRRNGKIQDLDPDFVLEAGDILVVEASRKKLFPLKTGALQGDI